MLNIQKLAVLVILSISSLFISCYSEDEEFKLLVLCDGPFEGTYIYNSNTPIGFGEGSEENPYHQTGSSYYYQVTFTDLDSVDVDVTRYECSDSIKIKIYRDDEKVKDEVLDADSDDDCSDNSLNMTYDYGEEEDDDDS